MVVGPSQHRSFQIPKELRLSAEVLALYDLNKRMLLECGLWTCCNALAHHGIWYRVSRWICIKDTQRCRKKYSQLDKAAVIICAMKKIHKHICERCFVIMIDHKPLVSLFGEIKQVPVTASPRLQRWAITLRGYEIH